MSKINFQGIKLLLLSTILYFIIQAVNIHHTISYLALLVLIDISIIAINENTIVSANSLFIVYSTYSSAFGPIILILRGIECEYDYFEIILGGLLVFGFGSAITLIIENRKPVEREEKSWIKFRMERKTALRLIFVISILSSLYYLVSNRVFLLSGNMQTGRVDAMSGNGLLLFILNLPILVVPMMYDLSNRERNISFFHISKHELFFMGIVSSATLLICGFRSPLMTMYICLAIMYIRKNKINNRKIISLGVAFIVIVEALGMLRSVLSGQGFLGGTIAGTFITSLFVNCINLNYIFNAFPNKIDFQYGYTYLINFIMLLPGPDPDFTIWLKESLGLAFSGGGVTPTIFGEFYINFGYIGIYFGMFFMGILGVYVWRYFKKHSETFLGVYFVWQFAHSASGGISNVIIYVLLFSIVYKAVLMFPVQVKRRATYE